MQFRWGDCELDREARTLSRAGRPVRAQPLVVDLLLLLLEHRERVVSDAVLRRRLWPGVQVTDASLRRLIKEARRAIGDDAKQQIQTVWGRGLLFAPPVHVEDGWDASFVGRRDVLEALDQKLEEVANGIGAVTLVRGPAGIGKTRILQEVGARADARGFSVLHGSGHAGARGDAFHPWVDAVRDLAAEFVTSIAEVGAPRDSSADAQRLARFRGFASALVKMARETPIVIALDDLQLADRDAIALLRFVAPLLVRSHVWILAAYRTSGGKASEPSLHELTALAAESATHVVTLAGLEADELRVLVRNQVHAEVGAPLAALLAERTLGNPLFAIEVARSLRRDSHSLEGEPAPELELQFARGVEPLVARRLSALSAEAQRLLRAASALGTEFEPAVVSAAERCSARAMARVLDEGEAAGLLVPTKAGAWRFAHPLFAEGLYAALDADGDAAAAQHLRIAEALERRGATDPFLVARHFVLARPAASAQHVLPYATAAASAAWQRYAFADAELWYREAIALAEEAGVEAGELCDLFLALGDVQMATTGVLSARPQFEHAAQLAANSGDPQRLARAALAFAHRPFALEANATVIQWLRAAHAAPSGDPSLDARVSSRLGSELMASGVENRPEAETLLAAGVSAARQLGDPFVLGRVLLDLSASQFSPDDPRAWISIGQEIERNAHESGDEEIELRGMLAAATGHLELGDRLGVESSLLGCQRFAREHALPYARVVVRGMEAMLALIDGRFADARAGIEASEREMRPIMSVGLAGVIAIQRFVLSVEEGRVAEAMPVLAALQTRFPANTALASLFGLASAYSGDLDGARGSLAMVTAKLPNLPHDRSRLSTLGLAAEISYLVHDASAAAVLELELAPYASLSITSGNASGYFGSVSQALGWAAAARGHTDEAVEHFRVALRAHEAMRSPPWSKRSVDAIAEVTDGRVALLRA